MTPEKGLLKLKSIASEFGWNFIHVHENLPSHMADDDFLISLAKNDATAVSKATEFMRNLFVKGCSCK